MAELNAESIQNAMEGLEKLANSADAWAGKLKNLSEDQQKALLNELKALQDLEKRRKLSAEDEKKFKQAEEQLRNNNKKVFEENTESFKKSNKTIDTFINATTRAVGASLSSTSAVYNSRDAFQAFISPLEVAGDLIKKVADVIGTLGSSTPIIGGITAALGKVGTAAVDLSLMVVKNQMQMASTLANTFKSVSDSGMTFGGNLDSFAQAAKNSGVNMQQFGEYISKNRDNLFALGGSIADNAVKLTKMGKSIGDTNAGLLASYGSYEALNEGISEYVDLQRRLGRTDILNQQNLTSEATEYLTRQRELSQLTGKSAQTLKDEEEKRRKSLDYQLKLQRMVGDQEANTREAIEITNRLMGDQARRYAEEFVATNGNVKSKEALMFQATQSTYAEAVKGLLSQTSGTKEEFRKGVTEELKLRKDGMIKSAKDLESFAEIQRASSNEQIKAWTETGATVLANAEYLDNFSALQKRIAEDAAKGPGDSSKAVADAQKALIETQKEIDEIAKKSMTRMSTFVEMGAAVQARINGLAEMSSKLLAVAVGKKTMSKEELEQLVNKIVTGDKSEGGEGGGSSSSGTSMGQEGKKSLGDRWDRTTNPGINSMGQEGKKSLGDWWDRTTDSVKKLYKEGNEREAPSSIGDMEMQMPPEISTAPAPKSGNQVLSEPTVNQVAQMSREERELLYRQNMLLERVAVGQEKLVRALG